MAGSAGLTAAGLLLGGCRQVVELDIPLSAQQLVINSVFNPDSVFSGSVSYTRHVLESARPAPARCHVVIRELPGNRLIDSLTARNNDGVRWKSSQRPEAGKTYRLRVIDDRGAEAGATVTMPLPVPITRLVIDTMASPQRMQSNVRISFSFQDPPGEANFYRIFILTEHLSIWRTSGQSDTTRFTNFVWFELTGAGLLTGAHQMFGALIMDDALFNGSEHTITLTLTHFGQHNQNTRLFFQHITRDHYRYLHTRSIQERTTGDPFAQPAMVFSNITNGLGILAAVNQTVHRLN
jgi:hypothetical protein